MELLVLILVIVASALFLIKGSLMVFRPESHFWLDRWLRGDPRSGRDTSQRKGFNLQWRIAGLIFIAVAIGFGRIAVIGLVSRVWHK